MAGREHRALLANGGAREPRLSHPPNQAFDGWLIPLKAFREGHGEEGGEVNASTPVAEDILAGVGATIMGRNMFGGGPGRWDDNSSNGWWGDDPPFHHPVFVLTHHPRDPLG